MSTQYPVLDNRPIDQWKVTELKEELKRRKLITKGLKDDLIRRLDDALRMEREAAEEEAAVEDERESPKEEAAVEDKRESPKEEVGQDTNVENEGVKTKPVDTEMIVDTRDHVENKTQKVDGSVTTVDIDERDVKTKPVETEMVEVTRDHGENKTQKVNDSATIVDIDDERGAVKTKPVETQTVEDAREHHENRTEKVDEGATIVDIDDSSVNLDKGKVQDGELIGDTYSVRMEEEPVVIAVSMETSISVSETVVTQIASSTEESKNNENQVKNEDPKHPHEDDVLNVSDSNKQVPEVSPVLGFQVNDSISSDSISINKKNELKDSLNANNFHLELEVVKPEMVEPSSSDVPPKGGDIPPLDERVPCENQSSIEEINDINTTNVNLSKKIDSADGGSSEKLNLDRSPGDDFMEEDVLESKHVDSNHNSDEMGDKSELHIVKEESPVDSAGPALSSDKVISTENNNNFAAPAEKRKFEGQEVEKNNDPPKRQRRWNSEALKVSEPTTSTISPSATPKDTFRSAIPKRNFTRSDSTLSSGADSLKERVVPPSTKPPTNSLRIDRFLRPFTLKAVQELLAKTGTVSSFWMDHIKTHCYVMYSSVEEAKETRNALYNLQWPANGGRLLVAEFVDPQEVKNRAEAPPQSPAARPPVSISPTTPSAPLPFQSKPSPRQHIPKEQLPPPPPLPLPPPPPLSNPPPARERLQLPPPPPLPPKTDLPILTLDDLFKKTIATPRIYYLPLSEKQVAAKRAAQGNNPK